MMVEMEMEVEGRGVPGRQSGRGGLIDNINNTHAIV
jgi:hypothetical protein